MMALFDGRKLIEAMPFAHICNFFARCQHGALVHEQRAVLNALEMHLTVNKAMLRAGRNGQILFSSRVKPLRIKRGASAAGRTRQCGVLW